MKKRIKDAEIITANWVDVTSDVIKSAQKLKYIIVPAVGYEWVDVKACAKLGIKVLNCPTHNTYAVAEHTLGLMFAISRKISALHMELAKGNWRPINTLGVELKSKNVLLIGYGNIGKKTEKLLASIGMKVNIANSKTKQKELDQLISEADYVVLNIPLNDLTKNLINKKRLKLMKPTVYLINTARGGVVDQKSLYTALKNNQIAGAGLDVFVDEPSTKGKPNAEITQLCKLPNVVATPHIAFNTKETIDRLGVELINNVKSILDGNPINVVN